MSVFNFLKKKDKTIPQRKDYQDFIINLNMKTLVLFEEMAGKSFYSLDAEDFELLIYCSLVTNNNQKLTYPQFKIVMKNMDIASTLYTKCQKEMDFMTQFNKAQKDDTGTTTNDTSRISDIINLLIINYNVDINYVMEKMRLWEIAPMVRAIEEKAKADMTEKRFWTYLQILPHIDGKKVKSPEKLLPFPWEKETERENNLKFMDDNKDAIKAFFNKSKDNE